MMTTNKLGEGGRGEGTGGFAGMAIEEKGADCRREDEMDEEKE